MFSVKNVQFTKLLKVEGTVREFNFRKTTGEGKVIFNVDVTDGRSNRIFFTMQQQEDVWKIQTRQLPSWILSSESNLHEVISEEMK